MQRREINIGFHSATILKKWKKAAGIALWKFAKNNAPVKGKLSGRNLYIDNETLTNAVIVRGLRPNVSLWKSAKAPIGQRVRTHPHPVKVYGQWKTVDTRTKTAPLSTYVHDVDYSKGRTIDKSKGFFGLRKDGAVWFYGLTRDGRSALPAYGESLVTWLVDEQASEVQRILDETFAETVKKETA